MSVKEKRERRAQCIAQARAILDAAEKENRQLTSEESANYDKAFGDAQRLKDEITREETLATAEQELSASAGRSAGGRLADTPESNSQPQSVDLARSVTGQHRSITLSGPTASAEYQQAFTNFLSGGATSNALQMDSQAGGGFIVAPQQFVASLIQAIDNDTHMRQICNVLPPITYADSLGVPSLDADPADPTWTSELSSGNEDGSMAFGKRQFRPHPLAQRVKLSKTLTRRSPMPVDQLVRSRLSYKVGVVMDYAYLLGSGAGQPLGVFVASNDGIPTTRDVSEGNEAAAIKADGLISAKYALKAQYRRNASWIFHRDAIKQISKLKDNDGNYLWLPSVRDGEPDRVLNLPYHESEYAPNTFTTGKYVGIVGDFSFYWIVDAMTVSIQVLTELYAEQNQDGYICRMESDGMPVLSEAFARVKLG